MATPIIADVRARWPQANVTAMCQGAIETLLLANPHLNELFTFSPSNPFLYREEQRNLILRLRQGKYDLGIILPGSFSSAWWLWRGKVRQRIGFATDWRRLLLTQAVPLPQECEKEHLVMTYKRLLHPLGISLSTTQPKLYITQEERAAAFELLRQRQVEPGATLIGINPAAAYGPAKCWLPDRFRAVIQKLLKHPGFYIVCFGDQASLGLLHRICESFPSRVLNLAGKTSLRELIALIDRCSLFLSNDSGPMHIASALGKPLVALFGSTNEKTTGPYSREARVIHKHVDCSPCYRRSCPIDFRCMKQIEVEEVYEAIMHQLAQKNSLIKSGPMAP